MSTGIRSPRPFELLLSRGVVVCCGHDGQMQSDEMHGFFAGDTRVLSTYRMAIGGHPWKLLGRSRPGYSTIQWSFQNAELRDAHGAVPEGELLLMLRRRVDGAMHDDLSVRSFSQRRVQPRFTLQLDADFADLFEVKEASVPPRICALRIRTPDGLKMVYEFRGFRSALEVSLRADGNLRPTLVGSQLLFDLDLAPGAEWTCCLEARPEVNGRILRLSSDPHRTEPPPLEPGRGRTPAVRAVALRAAALLQRPFEQSLDDLARLSMPQSSGPSYLAGGAPWFLAFFSRDSLVTSIMASLAGPDAARGALEAAASMQARERDDWRDAEPGKLPHEMRHGELARLGFVPHSPYYGTHDAPALFCLALWEAWRWTGDRGLLATHLDAARKALRWCEELGDRDGDGLLEYKTRSSQGYRNQSWKDAWDAIVHGDGRQAEPPLATVELQGYFYAARLALAELLEVGGESEEAARLRVQARELREKVEERFWMPEEGFYAVALDRDKRQVTSITTNPAHLLWCGLPGRERAGRVAARLLESDMFSGWGLRTLSSRNAAYNPLSYQRGSVWPHDTALAAAGLWRYGLRESASMLLRALLEAAAEFEDARLPELFSGLERELGPPIPYHQASSPQAWASAVPLLAARLFAGLLPEASHGLCRVDPWMPEWLPELELGGVHIGEGMLDRLELGAEESATRVLHIEAREVEVLPLDGPLPPAPLWAEPA